MEQKEVEEEAALVVPASVAAEVEAEAAASLKDAAPDLGASTVREAEAATESNGAEPSGRAPRDLLMEATVEILIAVDFLCRAGEHRQRCGGLEIVEKRDDVFDLLNRSGVADLLRDSIASFAIAGSDEDHR